MPFKIIINESTLNKNILKEAIDYNSFVTKDELCPHIFHENSMMKKEVRKTLMEVAKDFYDFMQFDWVEDGIEDVWLVGSLAGYNWSENYSDIDLHVIIDFSKISKNKDLVKSETWALKTLYNKDHNIDVKGFDVEVYAQDREEKIKSSGIYSVQKQTWIKKPKKSEVNINKNKINSYVKKIEKEIEKALKEFRLQNFNVAHEMAEDIKDMVSDLRSEGLEEGGEFASKNLAFKALRRNGSLDKLDKLYLRSFDKDLSIELTAAEKAEIEDEPTEDEKEFDDDKLERPNKLSKKDAPEKSEEEDKDDQGSYNDGITYKVNGRPYTSLRDAEKATGIPKSTIEYRVNSDLPKWRGYAKLT